MLSILLVAALSITPLGTFGNTYKIVEKDAIVEIEEKLKKIDYEKIRKELESKLKNYRPSDLKSLPPAEKTYSYYVDMTYTLDVDIPKVDNKGKIIGTLYPKGFTFNPVEYLVADPPPLIIFNGNNKKEVEWVKQKYKDSLHVMFVITEGDWIEISKVFKRQVYYLKEMMVDKLKLKNTVSVVYRDGKHMRVDVYAMPKKVTKKS